MSIDPFELGETFKIAREQEEREALDDDEVDDIWEEDED